MKNPTISVCCITYNRRAFLADLIRSVLRQVTDECEFIILDDGSADGTDELCKIDGVRYHWQENKGRPFARNKCVELANGQYIIWIDSDDRLAPRILEHYLTLIGQLPSCDIATGSIILTDANMKPIEQRPAPKWIENPDQLLPAMIFKNWISNGGTLIRKELFTRFGGYDEQFLVCQDYEWFSRIAGEVRVCHTDAVIQLWRIHNRGRAADLNLSPFEAEVSARIIRRAGLQRACPDIGWGSIPDPLAKAAASLKLGMRFLQLADIPRSMRLFSHAAKLAKGTALAHNAHEFLELALRLETEGRATPSPFTHLTDPLSSSLLSS